MTGPREQAREIVEAWWAANPTVDSRGSRDLVVRIAAALDEAQRGADFRRGPDPAREPDDDPLAVEVIGGRLVISIGVRTLAFAAEHRPDDPIKITDPLEAAKEVAAELVREEEDGTTDVHALLDKAVFAAWENGGEGFAYED